MFGDARGYRWMNVSSSIEYAPYHAKNLIFRHALENVRGRSCAQSPLDITVAVRRREHDHARIPELASDCHQRIRPVDSRQAKIHHGDVGAVPPELRDRFRSIRSLRHQLHIRLGANDRTQSLAENRVVFHHKDTDWLDLNYGSLPAGM